MKFTEIKTALTLEDCITIGKYTGTKIKDITDPEYLIFLEKAGLVKFDKEVVEYLADAAGYIYLVDVNTVAYTDEEIPF